MEILELEQKYSELKSTLNEQTSKRTKLILISGYFSYVLPNGICNLTEAYITEFIPDFLSYIQSLEIRGLNPEVLSKLQTQLKTLIELKIANVSEGEILKASKVLDDKLRLMNNWLSGENTYSIKSKIYFPVLEKNEDGFGSGYLESINIEIKNGERKFHISPSEYENDEQLEKQIELCFNTALIYCKKFIRKIKPTHTVYLHFENKLGIYSGNSLGIALTLIFIEAILKHYNSATVVNINGCIAVSGGIDSNSKIISTSKAIIEIKVETVFYSDAQIFCVSKIDEMWADEKLKELKSKYSNRDLKIIGLTDLNDLLDRRQVVDIRKQKLIVRSGKFVKKNWISAIVTVLLAMLFAYLFVMDFDDNPANLTTDGTTLFVKNKSDKILWTKKIGVPKEALDNRRILNNYCRIFDIDNDGKNDVLIAGEMLPNENNHSSSVSLLCYDTQGSVLWRYLFSDSVTSEREILQTNYSLIMIDTLTINNTRSLFLISSSASSFNSAIYRISLMTGKRLPGTLWSSGHTVEAIIKDLNNDGKVDLLAVGVDNGFEESVVWAYTIDTLTEVRASTKEYTIKNFSLADLISYVRIPKNDYENYKGVRITGIGKGSLFDDLSEKKFRFVKYCDDVEKGGTLWIKLDYNLKDIDIIVGNQFRVIRDTLVAQGKLSLPYTDTEEYKSIIKNNMLYWKPALSAGRNGKWVKRSELD